MESQNIKTKKVAKPEVKTGSGIRTTWMGIRPWVGSASILGLLIFEYVFISKGFRDWDWPISILVPISGVMAFFGVLFISNVYSKNPDLSNGEMRKAITAGVVVTYLFFIVTILFSSASPIYRLSAPAEEVQATETNTNTQSSAHLFVIRQDATPEPTSETEPVPTEPVGETEETPASQETTINTPLQLAASITNAFTSLVAIVVGFYFTTRSIDNYNKLQALKNNPNLANVLGEDD